MTEVYHTGELAVQELTGEKGPATLNGKIISDAIPPAALGFLSQQEICVISWTDEEGNPWARMIGGPAGFLSSDPSRTTLNISFEPDTVPSVGPHSASAFKIGDYIGVLCIELSTRRRLRINGRLQSLTKTGWVIKIDQAYPNCPKYIQKRHIQPSSVSPIAATGIEQGKELTESIRNWVTKADTCFVASAHSDGPVDTSHRGGIEGFIKLDNGALRIPDYPGNSMFNTLGNFHNNPKAGLTFIDFEAGQQLQITGDVKLDLTENEISETTGGTGRWWNVTPRSWVISPLNRAFNWTFVDMSPFNPQSSS